MIFKKGETPPAKRQWSKEKFTHEEIAIILAEADKMSLSRITKEGITEDPLFVGRFIRLLLYTGIHISNFVGIESRQRHDKYGEPKVDKNGKPIIMSARPPLSSKDISDVAVKPGVVIPFLSYRRVKKEKDNDVKIPLHPEIRSWLKQWLDDVIIRPQTRARYNTILKELQKRLAANGHDIPLNPKRFRHTAIWLLREAGLTDEEIERLTATSKVTLDRYGKQTLESIALKLEGDK